MAGIDVSAAKEPAEKAALLRGEISADITIVPQAEQLKNPDARISFRTNSDIDLLGAYAKSFLGLGTGDFARYGRNCWEFPRQESGWTKHQGPVETTRNWGGAEYVLAWDHSVAVARLLGYRWPAELSVSGKALAAGGSEGPAREKPAASALPLTARRHDENEAAPMRLSQRARELVQRCHELLPFADADGIVCLSATKGEAPAAERLRVLLAHAMGQFDLSTLLATAGPKGSKSKTLEDWLRDEFFEQHCAIFHNRPFIWHIWDGLKNGFSALVNYHRLDHANLEKLTFAYLGDWIRRQQAAVDCGEAGSDARLAAAKLLQARLKLILEGEPPYDIFVRWKPLSEQAIGWHPDLNDGVRMNIRPFLAQDIPGGKKGVGILRNKLNIKWEKDRGKEPQRDKAEFPWFWNGSTFTGDRLNDIHLTREQKEGARK